MSGSPIKAARNKLRDEDGLEPRERKWVDRVLIHGDMFRAHREAFGLDYKFKGYMRDDRVLSVLKREQTARHERYALTADHVLQELSYIIHARNRDLYNEDGSLKSPTELDDATDAAIAGIDIEDIHVETATTEGKKKTKTVEESSRVKKYKRYSKTEAISLAMKLRLLADVVAPTRAEVTGKDGAPLTAPPTINVNFGDGNSK